MIPAFVLYLPLVSKSLFGDLESDIPTKSLKKNSWNPKCHLFWQSRLLNTVAVDKAVPLAVDVVVDSGQLQSWSETRGFKLTFCLKRCFPQLAGDAYLHRAPLPGTAVCLPSPSWLWLSWSWFWPCCVQLRHPANPHQITELFGMDWFDSFRVDISKYVFTHFIWLEWEDESLVAGFGVGLVEEVDAFLQLVHVEHVVKAGVCVGNDVEDDVPVVLEGVHMMVDDHRVGVVLGLHFFAGLSVNHVDESLTRETASERSQSFLIWIPKDKQTKSDRHDGGETLTCLRLWNESLNSLGSNSSEFSSSSFL